MSAQATRLPIPFIDLQAQQNRIKSILDRRIENVLKHGQYILGPDVAELESALARFVAVEHCITVSSGTDALLIALMALGVGHGDEVITTPFSFIATAEAIVLLGATPVFLDICPKTYNLDPRLVEGAITTRTKAIMPVSLYGQCAAMDAINEVAKKNQLPVIEDAAQSFGATYKGKKSCGLTTIGCTSFFPSKPLGAYGDGGACFTNDGELAATMRRISRHGQLRHYYHTDVGINGRIDTLQAAILLAKLEIFPQEVGARVRIGDRYIQKLNAVGIESTPTILPHNISVHAQFTVQVDHRAKVQAALKEKGVPTAVHYPLVLHKQPALVGKSVNHPCPQAETASERVLSLPMHPYLSESDQDHIVRSLAQAIRESN
jgi:UDP-2-acetamido-2-deoxy-ribo-hexuluronate aminotransferase